MRRISQIEADERGDGARRLWFREPVEILHSWSPAVGDVLEGEFGARDGWCPTDRGSALMIRISPRTDCPVVVESLGLSNSLADLNPQRGELLRFKRVPDAPGAPGAQFEVSRIKEHERVERPPSAMPTQHPRRNPGYIRKARLQAEESHRSHPSEENFEWASALETPR